MFQHIDAYAGDPILSLMEEFSKDTRQNKVNLSIGLYYNEALYTTNFIGSLSYQAFSFLKLLALS